MMPVYTCYLIVLSHYIVQHQQKPLIMGAFIQFAWAAILIGIASSNKIITSPAVSNWGDWGNWTRCPFGRYAQAVQLRTEPYQGFLNDDTSANAIRLYCGDPFDVNTTIIASSESLFGSWGSVLSCRKDGQPNRPPDGHISGFQLRVETPFVGDNTATNNIRVFCRYQDNSVVTVEADGLTYGSWSSGVYCDPSQAVCAVQTQIHGPQNDGDDTALNNISMECCDQ